MTGYVRKDTTNNIADGNVINAADLDAEFDGVQDAFNASTGLAIMWPSPPTRPTAASQSPLVTRTGKFTAFAT